jgi:hypothetical protein
MFDFNEDFEEDFTPEFDNSQEHMEILKDRLARANYTAIKNYGINTEYHNNSRMLKQIISETMQYFEELEEYEKCTDLKRVLDTI